MAVCNIFSDFTNSSGNFIMFSQYVEDLTRNNAEGDNWKVVPSRFMTLDIDYSNNDWLKENSTDLNKDVPGFFQNYFENACAYGKANIEKWDPDIFKNVFWTSIFDELKLISPATDDENSSIQECMYYNDINMHAYNEHQGMGYGEIYCYIPTNGHKMTCKVSISETNDDVENEKYKKENKNSYLEGFDGVEDKKIPANISKNYLYLKKYDVDFDKKVIEQNTDKYNINTIILFYSILVKNNDSWKTEYSDIPMGIYFTGKFDNDSKKLTNVITKHVDSNTSQGTSYGLRVCTRFSATSNGIINTDIITDNSDFNYGNICQLMTKMNENLYTMRNVSDSVISTTQEYKESLNAIKNNRTNVPYIKSINGEDYWFVNGRLAGPTKTAAFNPIENNIIDNIIEKHTIFTWCN